MNNSHKNVLKMLLKDDYSENEIEYNIIDGWVFCHGFSFHLQKRSINMMSLILDKGYKLDVVTHDGSEFKNVYPNNGKFKLIYDCAAKAPRNGVHKWRVHIPELKIDKGQIFLNDNYIKDGFICLNQLEQNKYRRKIKTVEAYEFSGKPIAIDVYVDVYDIIKAFSPMGPALQHALKKVLCAGQRGHKDRLTDLNDILVSVQREIELEEGK